MPLVLLFIGLALITSGVRQTTSELFTLIRGDFTGPNNFIYWAVSIFVIGAIGYIKKLQPISDMFLVLVVVVLFLKSGTGFFSRFTQALKSTESVPNTSIIQ